MAHPAFRFAHRDEFDLYALSQQLVVVFSLSDSLISLLLLCETGFELRIRINKSCSKYFLICLLTLNEDFVVFQAGLASRKYFA